MLVQLLTGIGWRATWAGRLPFACWGLSLLGLGQFACGGSEADLGSDAPAAGGVATSVGGSGGAATASGGNASGGTGGEQPTFEGSSFRPTRIRIPDLPVDEAPCEASGDGAITAHRVLLGQTHLTPPDWPLLTISGSRPLSLAMVLEGSGSAPAVTVKAELEGEEITLCLTGPSALSPADSPLDESSFRSTLPAKWVQPGLKLTFSAGEISESLQPEVAAENGPLLFYLDLTLFGEGDNPAPSDAQWLEFLARTPFSYLDLSKDPFGPLAPERMLMDPRDDGQAPDGTPMAHEAIFVEENPHCSDEDKANQTCAPHSGFGTMGAVLGFLDTLSEANGLDRVATWYADLAVGLGGGLGGGYRGTGDDAEMIMNHELGHAWGFPHWSAGDVEYPYEGVQRERGGFGDSWAVDQVRDVLLDPLCEGVERQSPMQRAPTCLPEGSWFDPFSDYESARLLRMNLGAAAERSGEVPYSGGITPAATRSFSLREEAGRRRLAFSAADFGFEIEEYNEALKAYESIEAEGWNRILEREVPVMLFMGGAILGGEGHFEVPVATYGNVLASLDPSTEEGLVALKDQAWESFYWAHDLHLRVTLGDGSVSYLMYSGGRELRENGHYARFAVNFPRALGEQIEKLEVLSRPVGEYDPSSAMSEADTPDNFYDAATVLATWEKP